MTKINCNLIHIAKALAVLDQDYFFGKPAILEIRLDGHHIKPDKVVAAMYIRDSDLFSVQIGYFVINQCFML